ncbi:MAG: restriction endonuclease [Anaerolineales bacterium]|nr:restriction endonuclease [Anaerolineales bacterium]
MIIAGRYSFNGGEEYIQAHYPHLLKEVEEIISQIDAESCRLKKPEGREAHKLKRIGATHFYSPPHLNALFDFHFYNREWDLKPRIQTHDPNRDGYREMDFVKEKLGVEIQIGKYAFLTYDIVAKMVIFRNLGVIDCGIEVCPMSSMLPHLSSGIGSFEQVVWDLKVRGAMDKDVPVLLLGFEASALAIGRESTQKDFQEPEITLNRTGKLNVGTLKKINETGLGRWHDLPS